MNMMNQNITIFSIGTHLQAVECIIDGIKQWRWVAIGFEDESFLNGKAINPIVYADSDNELIEEFETE